MWYVLVFFYQITTIIVILLFQNALEDLMPEKRNMRMNMSAMHHMPPKNLSPPHNMSPQHMGMSPSHSNQSTHSNSMSPHHMNMSPQNMNMSQQMMTMSPQHVNMSPPQHVNISPPQHVNMSPDRMGMMNDMTGQNNMGYQPGLPKLVPNIQPRSPVLGTLMVNISVVVLLLL